MSDHRVVVPLNDPPALVVCPSFWRLLRMLPVDQRAEVQGTLIAIGRGWCDLKQEYLNIHSYDWTAMLDPPRRMLLAVGLKDEGPFVLVIDLFQIRFAAGPSPQDRLEAAQKCWRAWRP